ncbi:TetR/AcrR family transcriptional regulator [Pedobacter sp. MR2016-24]|uniref:TetR/AcrR family transcriptional regulator n=1 Tax=Pedobacter sp. MR2016-24 TaxID=2994466 RepID=UPI002246EBD8|nr:TetR/AcrR family transcriptional regulator [Pedobacter sp. MR2016-24]MCX2486455.1 TetR/AcrR family transcriptional regulator [Pedobacter sp. MR2016-24]
MAIKDRKERDKLDRRKLIIESATRLFLELGYEKTSIRTIADDIEYSPATIYLYFKEKDEIFYIIHEQGFVLLNNEFAKHVHIENPFERLTAIGHSYLNFALDNPDYYDLMFIMRAPLQEISCLEKWDAGDSAFQVLVDTVSEGIDQRLLKEADKFMVALTVWSYAHGLVSLYIRERFQSMKKVDDQVLKNMLGQSMDFFLKSIQH